MKNPGLQICRNVDKFLKFWCKCFAHASAFAHRLSSAVFIVANAHTSCYFQLFPLPLHTLFSENGSSNQKVVAASIVHVFFYKKV